MVTLAVWMETWLAQHSPNIRESTRRRYQGLITHHIVPLLGSKRLTNVTADDIDRLMRAMIDEKQLSAARASRRERSSPSHFDSPTVEV